ncbi:MAG: hypothetical protein ACK5UE_09480 [Chitinophagales bacterium]|nr:hypothetical protein [Sphingobacteriales bacterium]
MKINSRIIFNLPLTEIWNEGGVLKSTNRIRYLNEREIREILKEDSVSFVIADVGKPLEWIKIDDRFSFWKKDLQLHLAKTDNFYLEDYPEKYVYVASEWRDEFNFSIILLEKHH